MGRTISDGMIDRDFSLRQAYMLPTLVFTPGLLLVFYVLSLQTSATPERGLGSVKRGDTGFRTEVGDGGKENAECSNTPCRPTPSSELMSRQDIEEAALFCFQSHTFKEIRQHTEFRYSVNYTLYLHSLES